MIQIGDEVNGRYQLESLIVSSTVEDIWQVNDQLLGRSVALKIVKSLPIELQSDSSLTLQEYFLREARISAKLLHPHILPVYDYGIDGSIVYIVTANAYKHNLHDYIRNGVRPPSVDILRLCQRIASGIDYLHELNIVHGDIKPFNILLSGKDYPYIVNFGLSYQVAQRDKTKFDYVLGTPAYLAPEQIKNLEIDHRADLYAFGVIIYECLTGIHPYQSILRRSVPELLMAIMEGFFVTPLHEIRPDLPIGIDVILRRLMHNEPSKRYNTATEAVDALYRVFYSGQSNIEGKIFISYARKDSEYVHSLAKELRRIGLDIWIDQDIEPGSNWDEAIENGLNNCDMMLLITTEASMSSEYVTHEWSYFMGGGKPVYPFIPQSPIPNNIHPRLKRVQHVVGTDDMLNNVARIVDVLAGGTPTKLADIHREG